MKTTAFFYIIFSLIVVAACVPSDQKTVGGISHSETVAIVETTPPVTKTELSEQVLQNMTYFLPNSGMRVQMADGVYADARMMVTLLPEIAFGDIDGDLIDDAAVLLAESSGGTGNFVSLVVIVSHEEQLEQVGSILIDDRPVIESLLIEDGTIKLSAVVHGVNDPMTSPTLKMNQTIKLLENNLMVMNQTSTMPGGTMRNITIDAPLSESEVSRKVRISGSMPIAPFENNLRLRILDQTGMELFVSGFMVTSADVGEPAVFDREIILPNMPSGTWLKVELAEISMADGSVVCMDSVLVKNK